MEQKNFTFMIIIIILILIITSCYWIGNYSSIQLKKDKLFYSVDEINPELNSIDKIKKQVLNETIQVYKNNLTEWAEWPEKDLYSNSEPDGWKIFPFYAFGIWIKNNCIQCPTIYNFISKITGLKLATLSRLKAGTKLNTHQGWASHSNYVIRCHYGLIVPENLCYIYVQDDETKLNQVKYHKKFKWLIFDDSKSHYAENKSVNEDRIVLILDIERPSSIKVGNSDIGDSKELLEIVEYFRKKNIR